MTKTDAFPVQQITSDSNCRQVRELHTSVVGIEVFHVMSHDWNYSALPGTAHTQ